MARYIDADLDVSDYVTVWDCDCSEFGRQTVMAVEDLQYLPIADVAPKSEAAREIFEEIKKVIGEQYENYVFDNMEIEGVEQDAIIAFADAMKIHFAELKKKNTELMALNNQLRDDVVELENRINIITNPNF